MTSAGRSGAEPMSLFPIVVILAQAAPCPDAEGPGPAEARVNSPVAPQDSELADRLRGMLHYHGFSVEEMAAATGLTGEAIAAALERLRIASLPAPATDEDGRSVILPYPGGRHPRLGFLDGAIDPRTDTKVSLISPWAERNYAVIDLPEAIWWEDRLLFLAHTHIPTIWTEAGIELEERPWVAGPYRSLANRRTLPNGVAIQAEVTPIPRGAVMELSLTNGTARPLRRLRAQVCVLLRGMEGFERQTMDTKHARPPYSACVTEDGKRWVVTAWEECHRAWANPPCPCIHSDPAFPDCPPGETVRARGVVAFVEADDLDSAIAEVESRNWRDLPIGRDRPLP